MVYRLLAAAVRVLLTSGTSVASGTRVHLTRRVVFTLVVAGLLVAAAGAAAVAQRWMRIEPNVAYDGKFTFVRIRYTVYRRSGWEFDYPTMERNLMLMMREVTSLQPHFAESNIHTFDDPELLKYPIAYLSEPGCWEASESDVKALRAYLLKGGFLILDDFGDRRPYCPGDGAELLQAQSQIQRAIPGAQLVRLTEAHPIFDSFFKIESLNTLSEGGYRCDPEYYGIFEGNDPKKRMLALLNMNNDIGDYWQFSATGFVPIPISNEAYKLGVNYIVYALTH